MLECAARCFLHAARCFSRAARCCFWVSDSLGVVVDASLVPRMPQIDLSIEQQSAFAHMAHSLLGADIASSAELA